MDGMGKVRGMRGMGGGRGVEVEAGWSSGVEEEQRQWAGLESGVDGQMVMCREEGREGGREGERDGGWEGEGGGRSGGGGRGKSQRQRRGMACVMGMKDRGRGRGGGWVCGRWGWDGVCTPLYALS